MGARKKGCTQAKTTEIFCTICVDFQCQSRVKAKDLPIICKWYSSTVFLFSVRKKNTTTICRKILTESSVKMVSPLISTSTDVNNNNNNNFICIAVYTKALYRFTIKKENN